MQKEDKYKTSERVSFLMPKIWEISSVGRATDR